jgi:hypothetical protein
MFLHIAFQFLSAYVVIERFALIDGHEDELILLEIDFDGGYFIACENDFG